MSRNKILITVLSLITLSFVALLFLLTKQPPTTLLNQDTNFSNKQTTDKKDLVKAILSPQSININLNETFKISLSFENLSSSLQASDLILAYDTKLLEFVGVENLNLDFLNPRGLISNNNQLVLSFIEKKEQLEPVNSELLMADLVFKAKAKGNTIISPIINQEAGSSMVIISSSQDNQLTSANSVAVVIK